ncbi:hypothetical protein [Roseovarius sp.]|uniref:hypothetical protein n=1 Tax=Roseovarius sp. TaxID=1486281 RepID=UPI003A96FB42
MRRSALIFAGLLLGLVFAMLSEGRLAHLRALAPGFVPAALAGAEDQSSLWRGQTRGLQPVPWPVAADLTWRFDRLASPGALWSIGLSGPGLTGQGELGLPLALDHAELRAAGLEILLADWPVLIDGWPLGGLVLAKGISADLTLPQGRLQRLNAVLDWSGARLAGVEIGHAEVVLTSDAGNWRAPFSLNGDVIRASGTLSGRFGDAMAQLDLRIDPVGALPEDWLRALDQSGTAIDKGWQITRELDLAAGWPLF